MSTNIGFHTRLYSDPTVKVIGGSFGGDLDWETVERLLKAHQYKVRVTQSGTPVFVDRQWRDVWLYITVDARRTSLGKEALRQYRIEQDEKDRLSQEREKHEQDELEDAMRGLTHEQIIRRLRGV